MWSTRSARPPATRRTRPTARAACTGQSGSGAASTGRPGRGARRRSRTFRSYGTSRSCQSRSTARSTRSRFPPLSSSTSAAAARASSSAWAAILAPRLRLRHLPVPRQPAHPLLGGGGDHEDELVVRRQPVLHQQGHVVDDDCVVRRRRHLARRELGDPGVQDRVQPAAGGVVREHQPAEGGPVEAPVGGQHAGTEGLDHGLQARGARLDDPARQLVGVHDHRPQAGQGPGDGGLAGADPAGQTHPQHGRILSEGWPPPAGRADQYAPERRTTARRVRRMIPRSRPRCQFST